MLVEEHNKSLQEIKVRKLRSFVCRNSKLSPSKMTLFNELWPVYGLEHWQQWQGIQQAEIILEIGFGSGITLFEMAKSFPHQYFIGIEVYRLGIANLLSLLEKDPLPNLKLIWGDVTEILPHFEDATLSRIQIFFPDPWPKSRHHKRRLIQPKFVQALIPKLKQQGILHLATDWEDYALHMMKVLSQEPSLRNTQIKGLFAERPGYRPVTKYEKRGLDLQHKSRDLIFEKAIMK